MCRIQSQSLPQAHGFLGQIRLRHAWGQRFIVSYLIESLPQIYHYSYFADEETEVQGGSGTGLVFLVWNWWSHRHHLQDGNNSPEVYSFAQAAITKYDRWRAFNNRNVLSHSSGGWKSAIKASAALAPSEASGCGLLLPVFSMPFLLCVSVS